MEKNGAVPAEFAMSDLRLNISDTKDKVKHAYRRVFAHHPTQKLAGSEKP